MMIGSEDSTEDAFRENGAQMQPEKPTVVLHKNLNDQRQTEYLTELTILQLYGVVTQCNM